MLKKGKNGLNNQQQPADRLPLEYTNGIFCTSEFCVVSSSVFINYREIVENQDPKESK